MAVNLVEPDPIDLHPIAGLRLGFAEAGIKKANRRDVMVIALDVGASVAGVFTQNSFAAAPVQVCRKHLSEAQGAIRALVVNAGNANCGTGEAGLDAAQQSCVAVARLLGCSPHEVLPFSTGVILEPLPVERLVAALPQCQASLSEAAWADAAKAIMTTDTISKGASRRVSIGGEVVTVTGIAKGVGMLEPNMATMLAFVGTDARIDPEIQGALVKSVADRSFNRVTVDGDTSTNDSFVLMATHRAGPAIDRLDSEAGRALERAILEVAQHLAQSIARDGEGATKFITIEVDGAASEEEAVRVAKSIARSPLVKTAMFASDPNLGRLIMAIGNAGVAGLDTSRVNLFLGDVQVIDRGGRAASYREELGQKAVSVAEIGVRVELHRGTARTTVWTCDFSYEYVKINAEYRT